MKRFLLVSLLVIVALTGMGQTQEFQEICDKYKEHEDVVSLRVNRFGCFFLSLFMPAGKESEVARNFIRHSSSFQLLVTGGEVVKDVTKEIKDYIKKGQLEELLSVKDRKDEIKIYALDDEKVIRQLFISVVGEEKEAVFLQVKGKFSTKMIQSLAKVNR